MRVIGIGFLALVGVLSISLFAAAARADVQSSQGPLQVETMAQGLDDPWAIAFLPGGGFLVTEIDGTLNHFGLSGKRTRIKGVPEVRASGQGGLLDVVVARDFNRSREIFLSYAKPQGRFSGTAVTVARLSEDNTRLKGQREIFEMATGFRGGRHFGSRIVEARDGSLFVTIGDRGDRPTAQNLSVHNGKVVRLNRKGGAAKGNPFAGQADIQPEIYSLGHRNPQGATLDLRGRLWVVEHGAKGGDEINRVRPGRNYGWPVISYGRHYSGGKIGEGTAKAGMEQPNHYWDPSIAPSGMMIYSGKMFPKWAGDIFVGSLKFDHIARLDVAGDTVRLAENLQSAETGRVRDVREAPDGSIWFLSVNDGAVYRLSR